MNVVVFAKWVPLGTPELGEDRRLVRGRDDGLDAGDEFGIELALQLTEREGGEVTVVTMGPEGAVAAIQRALAMGAHRGVLISDDALAGADALATARVLAAAAGRQPFDLVVGGVESADGYTGTVPATVAELLDLPSVTFARRVDVGRRAPRRASDPGFDEVACSLGVVALTAGATAPLSEREGACRRSQTVSCRSRTSPRRPTRRPSPWSRASVEARRRDPRGGRRPGREDRRSAGGSEVI
jgi:electron transfer flavoprotein beta subunit